jgi:dienelactone hydrolase
MRLRLLAVFVLLTPLEAACADDKAEKPRPDHKQKIEALLAGRFRWVASLPLIAPADRPADPCFGIKDPTVVRFQDRWHVFATIRSQKRLRQIEYLSFRDWKDAGKAPRHVLKLGDRDCAAPQVFYYTPHRKWYMICQEIDNKRRPNHYPVYSTTTDPGDPASWSEPAELYPQTPENVKEWIDFWVICDETRAHLFFTSLDGKMWRAETRRADFPARWSKPTVVLQGDIFEASHTYRLKGLDKYLTVIEALDGTDSATVRRYYKAYLADRLDGEWKPLAASRENPFASLKNVRQPADHWTDSFSHGELLRAGHDELLEVDPGELRFVFQGVSDAARRAKKYGEIPWKLGILEPAPAEELKPGLEPGFFIKPEEVRRGLERPADERRLAFKNHRGSYDDWRSRAREKLAELLNVGTPRPGRVRELRSTVHQGVRIAALVMELDERLSLPAYLLAPRDHRPNGTAAIAIHGHGDIEPCIGQRDDYHRQFALELAKAGHLVLCPEVRGFGTLNDMAADRPGHRLDYWNQAKRVNDRQFTLVTDALIKGRTLVGETVEDLLRWEEWLAQKHAIKAVKVAGLSYGGDLALTYPVFSNRVDRIFASGTFGSFSPIFEKCYNAPAHCVPGVLRWLDRADIAGLNAPRPIVLHFGERDTPSRDNYSASYNDTVEPAFKELKQIYAAAKAEDRVRLLVSKGKGHEMDVPALLEFFR